MSESIFTGTRRWQTEQVFRDPEFYYQSLLDDINRASQSIIFNFYIFEFDQLGQRFCHALREASERGVYVRIVVDGIGSVWSAARLADYFQSTAVELRIFHPLPWLLESYRWSFTKGTFWTKFSHFISRINRRDHRKLVILDQQILWTGSFNISQCHLPAARGGDGWLDYGCRVTGDDARYLSDMFDQFWQGRKAPTSLSSLANFRVNFSARIRDIRNKKLLRQIRQAEHRIWISAAYFAPTRSIVRALGEVRKKGVDVRILTAGKSDVPLFPTLTASYYADLLKTGIRVFEYEHRVLHAKALLVDEVCIMGSSNLNHRSYYHDLEMDIVLQQPSSVASVSDFLLEDFANAREINRRNSSLLDRSFLIAWLPRLLRYWL